MFALLFMFFGIACGYFLRNTKAAAFFCRLVMPSILALLFCMGVLIGNNEAIMNNLDTLGLQGLMLAVATMTGSCLAVSLIVRLFFKNGTAGSSNEKESASPENRQQGNI